MKNFNEFTKVRQWLGKGLAVCLFLLLGINSYAQTTIAVQGGGTDVVNSITSCWGFSVTNVTTGNPVSAGSVNTLPRTGSSSIRVGGGGGTCTGGLNCIVGGNPNATGCSLNSDITFNTINIAPYTGVQFQLYHRSQSSPCSGAGFDAADFLYFRTSIDGGAFSLSSQLQGNSDYFWNYTTNPAGNSGNTIPNPYVFSPATTTKTLAFQVGVNNTNRTDEVAYIDDMQLTFTGVKAASFVSASTVCVGQTVTLSAHADVIADGNWDYQWNRNGTPITGETNATLSFTAMAGDNGATYSVTYSPQASAQNGGCTLPSVTSANLTLTVNPNPATPTLGASPNPICTGNDLTLTSSLVSGATYSWTGPNGYTANVQNPPALPITTTLQGGTYMLTVTENGCTASNAINVTVNATPVTPTLGASPNPICTGNDLTLTSSLVSGATYSWTGPNGYTANVQNPPALPITTTLQGGTYMLTVSASGCTASNTVNVTVNPNPATPTLGASPNPVCTGNNLTLTSSLVSGATYSWTGPDGYTANVQNPPALPITTTLQGGTYMLTVSASGCTASNTIHVTVNTTPATPTLGASPNPICTGNDLTLTSSLVSGATYSWTGPNGYTANVQNPAALPITTTLQGGTYMLTVSASGCTASNTVNVTVNATPATPTLGASPNPICTGNDLTLTSSLVSGATYSWTGPDGYTANVQNPAALPITTTLQGGTYMLTVSASGCTASNTINVTVNTTPATPIITINPNPICVTQNLDLSASSTTGATYSWTGPNSFSSMLQNPTINNVTMAAAGNYVVTATLSGCTATATSATVVVNPSPTPPSVSISPNSACAGASANLTAGLIAGASYSWAGPGGFSAATQNAVVSNLTAADAGVYTLTVTVSGCTASTTTVPLTVITAPVPTSIAVNTPTISSLNVSWAPVAGFTQFRIAYRVLGATTWTFVPNTTGTLKTVNGLQYNTTYEFYVATFCGNGIYSAPSVIVTGTTNAGAVTTCALPTSIYVEPTGPNSVAVTWKAPNNNVCSILSYGLTSVSPSLWTPILIPSPTITYELTGLNTNATYGYRIQANCTGCSVTTGTRSAWTTVRNFNTFVTRNAEDVSSNEIQESIYNNHVSLYPNPNRGQFNLRFESPNTQTVQLNIIDLQGRQVYQQMLSTVEGLNETTVSLPNIPAGLYSLQLLQDGYTKTIRLHVE